MWYDTLRHVKYAVVSETLNNKFYISGTIIISIISDIHFADNHWNIINTLKKLL